MNVLTAKKYSELYNRASRKANFEAKGKQLPRGRRNHFEYWRLLAERQAYQHFRGTRCKNKIDLIKIAGMAYSWMPTMLDLYFDDDYDFNSLIKLIGKCRKKSIDWDEQMHLMTALSLIVNHSIVGASKVLHIIAPDFIPFTDSRVLKGWNLFFKKEIRAGKVRQLPHNWSFNNERVLFEKVNAFTMYCDSLQQWNKNLNGRKSIRDIEVLFYFIGGKTRIDKMID
jgi:hypothetical protein